jgi:endosialidase-like protein
LGSDGVVRPGAVDCPTFYNNPTFTGNVAVNGTAYHYGASYFGGSNQSYFDSSGNLLVKASLDVYSYNAGWGNTAFRQGASDSYYWMEWVDTNGNSNYGGLVTAGTWRGGPVFYFDQSLNCWFNYQVVIYGNAQHHAACYFGNSNNSYFDSGGSMLCGHASYQARSNNAYFGSGSQSYFGAGSGELYLNYGVQYLGYGANWHTTKWDGSGIEWWVDHVQKVYIGANVSDERIKANIVPSQVDALAVLRTVPLFSFDMPAEIRQEDERHVPLGLVAQRLRPVIAEAVHVTEEDTWFLDYNPLVVYLIRAVQQLAGRLEAIEGGLH